MASEDDLIEARRAKIAELRAAGEAPFPNAFRATEEMERDRAATVARLRDPSSHATLPLETDVPEGAERHALYGRIVGRRGPFVVVRTPFGDAQILARTAAGKAGEPVVLSEADLAVVAAADLGDHVLATGPLIANQKRNDAAVRAETWRHLGKALLPPPDKWHGLTDVETRYRERYVDLFSNPEVARVFRARSAIVKALRAFMDGRGFLEVETPTLHPLRGGATAKPFETHHNVLDQKFYLRIAPELYLKRLVVGGLDRVYELARCFRNEGVSTRHNPEFTMLECYQAYATYEDMLELTESMVKHVDAALREGFANDAPKFWSERPFTLDEPFARVDMRDAILRRCDPAARPAGLLVTPLDGRITRAVIDDERALADVVASSFEAQALKAQLKDLTNAQRSRWFDAIKHLAKPMEYGERLFVLYEMLVEPDLPAMFRSADGAKSIPVFITGHPSDISPLARKSDADPRFTDRFELFVEGRELANAFSELNDPDDQAARFEAQLTRRTGGDDEAMDYDADYVRALRHGMPNAGGMGMGIDRLVMMLCSQPSIRDVLLFPALRHEVGTPPKGGA
jgi:lysyl-tRNA synthetase class 2